MGENTTIETAKVSQRDQIRLLYLETFADDERDRVAKLAVDLLCEDSTPPILSLVAKSDGKLVGHVAFSPVWQKDTGDLLGAILAPLAVSPKVQKQGIGSRLVEEGLRRLEAEGIACAFVYGDPAYYARFGFSGDLAERVLPPCELEYPFGWQALVLCKERRAIPACRMGCVPALEDPDLW